MKDSNNANKLGQSSNRSSESLEEEISLNDILDFLWKIRKIIIITLIFIFMITVVNLVIGNQRATERFVSTNFDLIGDNQFRLRVEVFGDRGTERRNDTPLDFDRDLNILIQEQNDLLSLDITNEKEDVIILSVQIHGLLQNRALSEFHQINVFHSNLKLSYGENSLGLPISSFVTNERLQPLLDSPRFLNDLNEFVDHFELTVIDVVFQYIDFPGESIELRYVARRDIYQIRYGADLVHNIMAGAFEVLEEENVEYDGATRFLISTYSAK